MLVVSDTTAITSLLKIGRVEILEKLFREVVIPRAVSDELLKYHSAIPDFLDVRVVADRQQLIPLVEDLDEGEAEAIVLAMELKADALLIDERTGREIAERMGISCLGLAGALLLSKRRGIISSLGQIFDELETGARFYLAADLKRELLQQAGE